VGPIKCRGKGSQASPVCVSRWALAMREKKVSIKSFQAKANLWNGIRQLSGFGFVLIDCICYQADGTFSWDRFSVSHAEECEWKTSREREDESLFPLSVSIHRSEAGVCLVVLLDAMECRVPRKFMFFRLLLCLSPPMASPSEAWKVLLSGPQSEISRGR
jgi:hypothetical protein